MTNITGNITQTLNSFNQELSGTVTKAIELIRQEESVPEDAREAIEDWFKEKLSNYLGEVEKLKDYIPDELQGWVDIIIDVVQRALM